MTERRSYEEIYAERMRNPHKAPPYKPGHHNYLQTKVDAPRPVAVPPSSLTDKLVVLVLIAGPIFSIYDEHGFDQNTPGAVAAIAALMMIPWYFSSRDRSKPPSVVETVAATCWRGIGLLLCGVLFALFVGAGGIVTGSVWGAIVAIAVIAFVLALVRFARRLEYPGVQSQSGEELTRHEENKKRYGWRF